LARAKHIDLLIEAANKFHFELKIVGGGRDEQRLKSMAGKTVEFLGNVTDDQLKALYTSARGFLFSAVDEEFGIAPIEAMGYGLPVIGFASGGVKETIKHGVNGFLYTDLLPEAIYKQVQTLERLSETKYEQMSAAACASSQQYSQESFKKQITAFVQKRVT
jgi:glycosyltransferase involved in cell wall biosynthesis